MVHAHRTNENYEARGYIRHGDADTLDQVPCDPSNGRSEDPVAAARGVSPGRAGPTQEIEVIDDFVDKLRLKEAASEDIYFARLDRRLLAALREKRGPQVQDRVVRTETESRAVSGPAPAGGRR